MKKEDSWYYIGSGGISTKESSKILKEAFDKMHASDIHSRLDRSMFEYCSSFDSTRSGCPMKITYEELRDELLDGCVSGYIPDFSYSNMVNRSCKCVTLYKNNTKMNKQIIEQIEKINGVKTVEPMLDRVVVTFEAEKVSVHCKTIEQFNFALKNEKRPPLDGFVANSRVLVGIGSVSTTEHVVIPFSQYLTDYNLTDEWEKYLIGEAERTYPVGTKSKWDGVSIVSSGEFSVYASGDIFHSDGWGRYRDPSGKWAEIIPNEVELVDGEIYSVCKNEIPIIIFRSNGKVEGDNYFYYSFRVNKSCCIADNDFLIVRKNGRTINPATNKQKRKLIRAELKNGYFHELRSKNS